MLVLPAELTHEEAPACVRMLTQALKAEAGTAAVADSAALVHFDSSALAVLLECRREALAMGKSFAVNNMSAKLRELATLYGISQLLPAQA